MGVFWKHMDKNVFLKSYNGVTGDIQFTENINEAKGYQNDWFAKAEIDYLKFHFPEHREEYLDKMNVYFT
jgi:hypothetical protein